jgi:hypothetical protein
MGEKPFIVPGMRAPAAGTKTCQTCGHTGLVWYHTKSGKWMLADPFPPGSERAGLPNPRQVHLCPNRGGNEVIYEKSKPMILRAPTEEMMGRWGRCNDCGRTGVRWMQTRQGWRLFYQLTPKRPDWREHVCERWFRRNTGTPPRGLENARLGPGSSPATAHSA